MANQEKILLNNAIFTHVLETEIADKIRKDGYYCIRNIVQGTKGDYDRLLEAEQSRIAELFSDKLPLPKTLEEANQRIAALFFDDLDAMTQTERRAVFYYATSHIKKNRENEITRLLASVISGMLSEKTKFDDDEVLASDVKIVKVSNFKDFIKILNEIRPDYEKNETQYYRGVSNINNINVPSLFRRKRHQEMEDVLYQQLVLNCPSDFSGYYNRIERLVAMQHYGLPTRLLDITENPLVALYFACISNHNLDGEVVVYRFSQKQLKYSMSDRVSILSALPVLSHEDRVALAEIETGDEEVSERPEALDRLLHEIKIEKPAFMDRIHLGDLFEQVPILPSKSNPRIMKQEGAFILYGLLKKKQHNRSHRYVNKNGEMLVLKIAHQSKKEILEQLKRIGINHANLFPEIDEVAKYLRDKFY